MTHEQVIEKVRRLLALSKSDNEHEAAAAAGAAERLLQEYRLSEGELEGGSEPTERAQEGEPLDALGHALPTWKSALAGGLSRLHGCKPWSDRRESGVTRIRIVGRPSDVATVRYLYAWLTSTIDRLAHSASRGRGRTWANSYRIGCAAGVIAAMDAANQATRGQATSSALVKVDQRATDAEREMRRVTAEGGGRMVKRGCHARIHRDAYERGQTDGRAIHTGASLPSGAGPRMLGTGR